MKKKLINLSILFLISFNFMIYATKVASLPEVQRPYWIGIKNNKLIVSDRAVLLHMYSMKDFSYKLLSSKGEGPGESRLTQDVWLYKDNIFTFGSIKGMSFDYDGKYLDEFRIILPAVYRACPLGRNLITKNSSRTVIKGHFAMEICLYNFSKEKVLKYNKILYYFDCEVEKNGGKVNTPIIKHYYDFMVEDDKLFVGDTSRGFYVEIFDSEGNEAGKVRLYLDKVKIPETVKDKTFEELKKARGYDQMRQYYNPYFPEYYPDFYRFDVEDGKIYFLTYKSIESKRELIVTDYHGKILKRSSVPWSADYYGHTHFTIMNGKYYYLKENEADEEWELHVEELK